MSAAATQAADVPVLELRGITKAFPGIVANDHVDFELRQRRGARAARRERRRQVDADEHPLRALQARRGRDPARRQAGHVPLGEGRDRGRDRDGAPALHAHPGDDRRREHRARHRAVEGRRSSSTSAAPSSASASSREQFGLAVDPTALDLADHGRPAAARRDPEGALPRRRDPDPRRADRGADAAGGGRAVRDRQAPRRPTASRSSSSATSSTRCSRSPTGSRCCAAASTIETVPCAGATEESLARMMVGRDVLLRVDKPPAHAGRAAARRRGPARARRPRHREGARRLVRGARRRDRRHRRRRRQRPDRADRRDHRPAARPRPARSRSRAGT